MIILLADVIENPQVFLIYVKFNVLCCCNFDGRTIDVILMYFFDIISMDGKSMQLQRSSFNVFLKDKNSWSF